MKIERQRVNADLADIYENPKFGFFDGFDADETYLGQDEYYSSEDLDVHCNVRTNEMRRFAVNAMSWAELCARPMKK